VEAVAAPAPIDPAVRAAVQPVSPAAARTLRAVVTPPIPPPPLAAPALVSLPEAPPAVDVATPLPTVAYQPAPSPDSIEPAEAPAPPLVRVQVNADPWAYIRVDGVEVGATPLGNLQLPAGPHEFEAHFPDGRRLQRRVEIGPELRFVSLP
jgi:hypothetical protein